MKKLTLLMVASLLTLSSSFADPFEDANRAADAAFAEQEKAWNSEVQMQDAAWDSYIAEQEAAWQRYSEEIDAHWGAANGKKPSRKAWVDYSQNRDERSSIDFESGTLQVEAIVKLDENADSPLVKERIRQRLEKVITQSAKEDSALKVTPPASSAADMDSRPPVYPLKGQLRLSNGEEVTPKNASEFVEEVIEKGLQTTTIQTPQGDKKVLSVSVALVPDHLERRAKPYLHKVRAMADQYHIPVALIFGIMQTESYFNPMARSRVPAYGLMQLVPPSGGRDAYQYVFKRDRVVSGDYLYVPDNNIELGSAYLKLLQIREMRRIKNKKSRMLCAIAAYNTGGGNVAKAFIPGSKNIARASKVINSMTFEQVYHHLRNNLPYEETRNYVKRVWTRMDNYKGWEL